MFENIIGAIRSFFPSGLEAKRLAKSFLNSIESEAAEEFLQALLNLMKIVFVINKKYRENIKDFTGNYLFRSEDNEIVMSAIFADGKMQVKEKKVGTPDITVTFKDGKALMQYLLSSKPDILDSLLKQKVTPEGNLNYLYKFGYMATHLQLMAKKPLSLITGNV